MKVPIEKWRQRVEGSPLTGAAALAKMRDRFLELTEPAEGEDLDHEVRAARQFLRETVDEIVNGIIADVRAGRSYGR